MAADAAPRLRELGDRYALSERQREQLATLLGVLERDPHAPTAVRDPLSAADRHLADSLAGTDVRALREARSIADLGSGAGLPGLVLAIALPEATVSLIESNARRCAFIAGTAAKLGLGNATGVHTRVEDWREGLLGREAAVARALAPQPVVLEYAAPLLRPEGVLVDWRGARSDEAEVAAARAAKVLGLEREEVLRVEPFAGARELHLHVFRKVAPTPARFPRRAGVARKRPLAG